MGDPEWSLIRLNESEMPFFVRVAEAVKLQPLQHKRCVRVQQIAVRRMDEDRPVSCAGSQGERLVKSHWSELEWPIAADFDSLAGLRGCHRLGQRGEFSLGLGVLGE